MPTKSFGWCATNEIYKERMKAAVALAKAAGVTLIEAENAGETFGLLGAADAYHDPFAVKGDLVEESQGSDGLVEDAP